MSVHADIDLDVLIDSWRYISELSAVDAAERPTFTVHVQGVTYEQNYAATAQDAERMARQYLTSLGFTVGTVTAVERQFPVVHTGSAS